MFKQNIFVLFTLTLFLTSANAQNPVNQFDNDGLRHGYWTKNYHKTNEIRYEGVFYHGKEIDSFKFYTLSGGKSVLSAVKVFNETDSIADVTFFTSTKKVISEGKMNGKRFIGPWTYYHKNSDIKMIEEHYNDDGVLDGDRLVYFKNGTVAESAHYKNGILDGESKWFSEKGILLRHTYYRDGELEGITINYDALGNKTSEGNYSNSKKTGIWNYYKDGKLTKEINHTTQEVVSKKE